MNTLTQTPYPSPALKLAYVNTYSYLLFHFFYRTQQVLNLTRQIDPIKAVCSLWAASQPSAGAKRQLIRVLRWWIHAHEFCLRMCHSALFESTRFVGIILKVKITTWIQRVNNTSKGHHTAFRGQLRTPDSSKNMWKAYSRNSQNYYVYDSKKPYETKPKSSSHAALIDKLLKILLIFQYKVIYT